jgi:uncharacterized protein YbaP (TraB family)
MMVILAALLTALSAPLLTQTAPTCPPEARPPSAAQIEDGVKNARDHGFLWRATRDGRTSYLYGTMHVGRMEWMFPGPEVLRAARASDIIALELDVLDPDIVARLQAGSAGKAGRALPDALNQRLRVQLRAACLPEELLSTMAPEMVATTLTMLAARKEGLDPAYAVDGVYAVLARTLKKPVSSLETPELQLKLLLGGSAQESRAGVESALEELETGKAGPMLTRMAEVWAQGKLGEMEKYEEWCQCLETEDDRAMMRHMLDERNPGLAKSIDAIHTSGKTVFAAVGSLHMIGKLGLPALLRERGYAVERVDFKP